MHWDGVLEDPKQLSAHFCADMFKICVIFTLSIFFLRYKKECDLKIKWYPTCFSLNDKMDFMRASEVETKISLLAIFTFG